MAEDQERVNINELTISQIRSIGNEYYNGFSYGWSNIAKICPYSLECAAGKAWMFGYSEGINEQGSTETLDKT